MAITSKMAKDEPTDAIPCIVLQEAALTKKIFATTVYSNCSYAGQWQNVVI